MNKNEVIEVLEDISRLLELKNENPFKIRAYHNAAHSLLNMKEDLCKVVREKRLTELEGIGESLAEKISQLVVDGHLPFYEELKRSVPKIWLEMMQLPGLGPRKVVVLAKKLRLKSLKDLKRAAKEGKIAKLKGFGEKMQQRILDALSTHEIHQKRRLWWEAMELAEPLLKGLEKLPDVEKVAVAGSLRRGLETIGDLDFVVGSSSPKRVMDWFIAQASEVLAHGATKSSIRLKKGMQADLRIVPVERYAFALCYSTGSKEHNITLRKLALKRKWSLSEYGFEKMPGGEGAAS